MKKIIYYTIVIFALFFLSCETYTPDIEDKEKTEELQGNNDLEEGSENLDMKGEDW